MPRNNPKKVIFHCAATPDFPKEHPDFDKFGAELIDEWHKERGWKRIGYHYVIRRTGIIEPGRPETTVGAHCAGHNQDTLGVCYIGTEKITANQIMALRTLFDKFLTYRDLGADDWFPHNHFNSAKTCPGVDWELIQELMQRWQSQHSKSQPQPSES